MMISFASSPVKSAAASPSIFPPESQLCPLSLHLAQNQAEHGRDNSWESPHNISLENTVLTRERGDICILLCVHAFVLSYFSRVWLFAFLWTVAHQAPLSMGFSRQEHWNGLPCPPPGDLPNSGIEPTSYMFPALSDGFFTTSAIWEVRVHIQLIHIVVW